MTRAAPYEGEALSYSLSDEGVLEVELHSEPANEIGSLMLGELERVVAVLKEGPAAGVRAMVLHGRGRRGFCAGADLRELHRENSAARARGASDAERQGEVRRFIDRIHAVMDALDEAPVLTVAALHGVVFGGGFELALACDVMVADKSARFGFPELRLGLVPGFGGIPRLEREVGAGVVRDLLFTGRSLGAARAYELGLVSQLVAPGEALVCAQRTAVQGARFSPATFAAAKRFVKPLPRARLDQEKALFCELFLSPAVDQALARFASASDAHPYLPPSASQVSS